MQTQNTDQSHASALLIFDWVMVPAGACLIGEDAIVPATDESDETPAALLELPAYTIGRTPVTNAQYAAFVAATDHRAPAHWEASVPPAALALHPVTYVDWHDAIAFCEWARVCLPTEAEWEQAARGDDGRPFPWGTEPPGPTRSWFNQLSEPTGTRPVGERLAGASPYGALDMAGNVWEWTASLHWPYPYRCDGREDRDVPGQRVLRGGSFRSAHERYLRCAFRSRSYPARRRDHIGFRVARTTDWHKYE